MKQNRTRRSLAIVFSLLLAVSVIFSIFAITSSAEENEATPTYDYSIKSLNISYSDSINILIALDAPSADGITVTYDFNGNKNVEATYWKMMEIPKDSGNYYPVYFTEGVSAKDMGEDIVVTVKNGDTVTDTDTLSVARYLYIKLFELSDDYLDYHPSDDTEDYKAAKKSLYENLLKYGANAQEVLWNNKNPEDIRTLVTDYTFVGAVDGKIGSVSGDIIKEGEKATITYAGSDANFAGWKVTTYEEGVSYSEIVYGKTATVSNPYGHVVAKPYIEKDFKYNTFDGLETGVGIYVAPTDGVEGAYKDTKVIENKLPSFLTAFKEGSSRIHAITYSALVEEDADGNKYFRQTTNAAVGMDASIADKVRPAGFYLHNLDTPEDGESSVLEFDVYVNSDVAKNTFMQLSFYGENGKNQLAAQLKLSDGNVMLTDKSVGDVKLGAAKTWFNLRIEQDANKEYFTVYNDGLCVAVIPTTAAEADRSSFVKLWSYHNSTDVSDISFDNFFFGYGETTFGTVDYVDFEGPYVRTTSSFSYTTAPYNDTFIKNEYVYQHGLRVFYSGATKQCEGDGVLAEENGNNYLKLYTQDRQHESTKDRGYELSFSALQKTTEVADYYVFDFDMRLDSKLTLSNNTEVDTNNVTQINFTGPNGYQRFDTNKSSLNALPNNMEKDTWNKVRFIYKPSTGKIDLYTQKSTDTELVYRATLVCTSDEGVGASGHIGNALTSVYFCQLNDNGNQCISIDNVALYGICAHVDANDNARCDKCNNAYTDGCNLHRDANDDGLCDKCAESFRDYFDPTASGHIKPDGIIVENMEGEVTNTPVDSATAGKPVNTVTLPYSGLATSFPSTKLNITGTTTTEVIADALGNKVLHFYSPGRTTLCDPTTGETITGNNDNRPATLSIPLLNALPAYYTPNAWVFSMDVAFYNEVRTDKGSTKATASPIELPFWNASGKYTQVNSTTNDNRIGLKGYDANGEEKTVYIGNWNEVISLTLAVYNGELLIFANGELAGTLAKGASPKDSNPTFAELGAIASLEFNPMNSDGQIDITLDNISSYNCVVNDGTYYDFQSSAEGPELPAGVTATVEASDSCREDGASLGIKELKDGNKVLSIVGRDAYYDYETNEYIGNGSGKNHTVSFAATGDGETFVADFDLILTEAMAHNGTAVLIEVEFYTTSGCTRNAMYIQVSEDGKTFAFRNNITDNYDALTLNADELNKVHFEENGGLLALTVNGVSHGSRGLSYPAEAVTEMRIEVYNTFHGEILIDNVIVENK